VNYKQLKSALPKAKIVKINNIDNYRGFYVELEDCFVQASFNEARFGLRCQYKAGFELTFGNSIVEHIYNKLKNQEKLSKNEAKEFYERVNLFSPIVKNAGILYDFREVLYRPEKVLNFFTLEKNLSKIEIEIFQESPYIGVLNLEAFQGKGLEIA
jgi:hypothetical protein